MPRVRLTKRQRPLYGLLAANAVSQFGNTFSAVAIPWFVLETTGSASQTGISVATGVVPYVVVGILSGSIVDRIGYRRASIISDGFSFLSTLLIPVLYLTRGLEFWQLLLLVFFGAFFDSPGISARQALLPELAEMANVSHERANASYSLIRRFAGLLGPPIAGVLLTAIGPANLLFFNAATFVISASLLAVFVPTIPVHQESEAIRGLHGYVQDVKDGLRYLAGNRLIVWIVLTGSIGSLVAEPLYTVILPVYANEVLGSATKLGIFYSALAAGSILGHFLYLGLEARVPRGVIQIGGYGTRALAFTMLIFTPEWWVIALALFVGAVGLEPVNPMMMSILQEQVPPGMRARIYSVASALFIITMPIGIVAYGYLISWIGMDETLRIFVALNLALPLIMLCVPDLRHIPRLPPRVVSTESTTSEATG